MLAQRRNLFDLPIIILVIALAIFGFLLVRAISSQTSTVSVSQTTNTVQTVPVVAIGDVAETVESLTFNQQASSLAPNWTIFQASLNHADYPGMTFANRETAKSLTFNQQASGLAPNWTIFQASLNHADYPGSPSSALPPQGETGRGPY